MKYVRKRVIANGVGLLLCALVLTGCQAATVTGKDTEIQQGDEIVMGPLTLSIQSRERGQEVAPENPEGYYDYYEPHEGYEYYIISGEAENTGAVDIYTENFVVQAVVGDKETEGKLVFLNEELSELTDVLNAGETRQFRLFMIQKLGDQPPEGFAFYYHDGFEAGDLRNFDHKTTVMTQG